MPALEDLYREIVLDHYRNPRNRGELPCPPAKRAKGFNPLCGDEVIVFVEVDEGGRISDVRIDGQGCSISQAAASMMSVSVKGKTLSEARELERAFKTMMVIEGGGSPSSPADLGDLAALQGVKKFPVRIKCATLCWNTLSEGLTTE